MEQQNTVKVNEYIGNTCLGCDYAKFLDNGNVNCTRRINENIIVEISSNKVATPCHAREVVQFEISRISDKYLDTMKSKEYKKDLELRSRVYTNDVCGGR